MKLTCLIDSAARPHSAFETEPGLAFLIDSAHGSVLFDTGLTGRVLLHNLGLAGRTPEDIAAVALSHAHRDHSGGLADLLERRPDLPVYAHPDLLRERFSRREGAMRSAGLPPETARVLRRSDLRLSEQPQQVLPGVWTSGAIEDRPEPEGRSAHHYLRQGEEWVADPYRDDMALIVECAQGLVLICGCCHAGIMNTLRHVERQFGRRPAAVVGGMHLVGADAAQLRYVIGALDHMGAPMLYPNHCTGEAAYMELAFAFGERVGPFPAGAVLEF
ncbi:MAG: MBL fold metallo-hydrolase [Anaerolineae bacterium]|nr:MBL fold metallo-hydrolase [Anaerolineae bacterium]